MLCFSFHSSGDRCLELAVFLAKTIQQVIRTFLQLSSCQTHFLHESVDRTPIMIRFPVAYSIHLVLVHFEILPDYTRGE